MSEGPLYPHHFVMELKARIAELEDIVSSQRNTTEIAVESERERIFGLLNTPSHVLTAAMHYTGEGKAWLSENFLACYLKPTQG